MTSAYHPNTNGQCERLNQTLISSLRKHCEAHPTDWYKWLPYVLISYRTRIHSVTGMSPFHLMFSREMLTFKDWSQHKEMDEILAINNRTDEIKKHFDITIPNTVETIEIRQQDQIKTQNKTKNVREAPLSKGTVVYVKCEGLLSKREPRFKGPSSITMADRGNKAKLKIINSAQICALFKQLRQIELKEFEI